MNRRRDRLAATARVAAIVATLVTLGLAAGPAGAQVNGPVFIDGQAQPVFTAGPTTWVRQELWVESKIDSDFDGKLDRIHADVTRVQETETIGLKVPVVFEVSPYYGGDVPVTNWNVDHEIGDSLNGRARAFTSPTSSEEVFATWTTGKVGMIGTSYNGTLPIGVATTGVEGLEAIVPISAISSWYDYYRANGMVRAPGGFQGEDADVLAEYTYTRPDQDICRPVLADIAARQDRVTGDYIPFWDARNYMNDIENVHAASLVAHGNNDWNVMTKHAAVYYQALKARGVPHQLYWHQGGHGGSPPLIRTNRWFTPYLWGVDNGVENDPKAWVVREGQIPQNPTPYPEWPDPGAARVTLSFNGNGLETGQLTLREGKNARQTLVDNATISPATLMNAASSPNRLLFKTPPLLTPIRISGTPTITLTMAFSKPKANLTAHLISYPSGGGSGTVISRGWIDPENRTSPAVTEAIAIGKSYKLTFDFQPKDSVVAAGRRLGVMILSSDRDYTVRPAPGTELTMDLSESQVRLPIVGGPSTFTNAFDWDG